MNFLALCNRLRESCGISGDGPSTVEGQVGEMSRVVNWINEAYLDIQQIHPDWRWLRKSFSFPTVAGQTAYSLAECGITDHGQWDVGTFRCYPTAVGLNGEMLLCDMDYEHWRNLYQLGAMRAVQTRPTVATILPDNSFGLGSAPDATGYTIIGDYYAEPSEMALDADIPLIPAKHHMAIVYRAMMFYGVYEAAPEVFLRGETEFKRLIGRMRRDQLPQIRAAGCLA